MTDHTHVFVGGLHRSATTLLARAIADHPDLSGFAATPAAQDEGQHLQTVYLPAKAHGGAGKFGFDPAAHLTEASPLATPASAARLLAEWSPWWDMSRRVLVEKSPPNLIRARFLQALFPEAAFVMITRHPAAVSLATQRWARTTLGALLRHWVHCHDLFEADRPHLRRVHVVRYEDLVAEPERCIADIHAFLGVEAHPARVAADADGNAAYFARWRRRPRPLVTRRHEAGARRHGYSLVNLE